MNTVRVEVEDENGNTRTLREQTLDPIANLYHPGPHAHAHVGFTVGTQVAFGKVKVSCVINLECDQNTATLDEAAVTAFTKATEYMQDGLQLLTQEAPPGSLG